MLAIAMRHNTDFCAAQSLLPREPGAFDCFDNVDYLSECAELLRAAGGDLSEAGIPELECHLLAAKVDISAIRLLFHQGNIKEAKARITSTIAFAERMFERLGPLLNTPDTPTVIKIRELRLYVLIAQSSLHNLDPEQFPFPQATTATTRKRVRREFLHLVALHQVIIDGNARPSDGYWNAVIKQGRYLFEARRFSPDETEQQSLLERAHAIALDIWHNCPPHLWNNGFGPPDVACTAGTLLGEITLIQSAQNHKATEE